MSDTPGSRANLHQVTARNTDAYQVVTGFASAMPTLADVWDYLQAALDDVPALCAELADLRAELSATRLDRATLLAAARATLAAHHDGEADPLFYLRDELAARGQLPPGAGRPA